MILDNIVAKKHEEVRCNKENLSVAMLLEAVQTMSAPMNFKNALKQKTAHNKIIAEIKKASPSKGIICKEFFPVYISKTYEQSGAAAISVLTDESFFMGNNDYLTEVKQNVSVPVLRKDFLIDPYQIYESRSIGADAVLLIVAILEKNLLKDMLYLARELHMESLVEVHSKREIETALEAGADIIGINNRDLHTFETSIETTLTLINEIPDYIVVVSESGIGTTDDLLKLKQAGADAFLIGESLMRDAHPGSRLRSFITCSGTSENQGENNGCK